jgi:hypothetical protein
LKAGTNERDYALTGELGMQSIKAVQAFKPVKKFFCSILGILLLAGNPIEKVRLVVVWRHGLENISWRPFEPADSDKPFIVQFFDESLTEVLQAASPLNEPSRVTDANFARHEFREEEIAGRGEREVFSFV